MASYNRVILVGNLTRNPELRALQSGTSLANIGLAVNDRKRSQNGDWVEETSFFDVEIWGRSAEIVRDYTRKGSSILVEGKLKQDVWEQDGQKRSKIKIVAERVVLLSSNAAGQGNGNGNNDRPTKNYAPPTNNAARSQSFNSAFVGNGFTNAPQAAKIEELVSSYSAETADDIPF